MTQEELERQFPEWLIWRGQAPTGPGRWYAIRREESLSHQDCDAYPTGAVSGNDATELATALGQQPETPDPITLPSRVG